MKRNFVSFFVTLGMLVLGSLAFAQSDTQSTTATVTAVQTFSITAGNSVTLTPSTTAAATDSSTELSFSTNDGNTYAISVVADTGGWAFTPSVTGNTPSTYPVLSFQSSATTDATASTTAADLIDATNTVGAAATIVTGINNVTGTATVTLGVAQVSHDVTAGDYAASLTYTMQ